MTPTAKQTVYTSQMLASQEFFNRSTSVLEEADSGFRPGEPMMTVAQHVAHTAQTLDWFVDGVTRPEGFNLDFEALGKELEGVTSLAAARSMLDAAFARTVRYLGGLSEDQLAAPLPPGPIMGGMPLSSIVWAMVEHTAHHRGALTVYSRLLGKVPPMPYGG